MKNQPNNPKPLELPPAALAAFRAELEWARTDLGWETLETRNLDSLDFHEVSVTDIRDLVRHAFESGYRQGRTRKSPKPS